MRIARKSWAQVIRIDDERVQNYLRNTVRDSVEETLNAMLDAEAEHLCKAGRYERTEARRDTRAGSYSRMLQTQAGEVTLKVPGPADERCYHRLSQYRAPLSPNQCAKDSGHYQRLCEGTSACQD